MRFLYLSLFALTYSVGMLSATDDLIYLRGKNEPVKGFINKESETEIYFKDLSAGSTRKLSFSVIRKIVYGDANTDYKIALDAFHVGNYKYASRKFSDARRSQKQSRGNWHKYYIPWYYYHTQYKLFLQFGKDVKIAEKIITGIEKFVGLFPKSRFTGVAQITIGDMYFKLKKFKEAKKAYSDIAKKSKNKVKRWENLNARGMRLGETIDATFECKKTRMLKGDIMVWYTDGWIENTNEEMEEYGKKRMQKVLEEQEEKPPNDMIEELRKSSWEFYDGFQREDDLTIVIAKITEDW